MKKLSFLALAAVGLLLGACSSDKDVAEVGNDYKFVEGQTSYISIGISMPGNPMTRANDDLKDGDAAEFAVKDGMLVLFKGTSEATATLVKAYDITDEIKTSADWQEGGETTDNKPKSSSDGEITTTSKRVVKAIDNPNLATGQNLYAYVILNNAANSLAVDNTPGQTFADFSRQIFDNIGNLTNGLIMTSVPLSDSKQGGSVDPTGATQTTLSKIDTECIYDSEAKAAASTDAACIYVERAAVKVEVSMSSTGVKDPTTGSDLAATDFSWGLGNTNSTYFNTRQVNSAWLPYFNTQMLAADLNMKWRFVGNTAFFSVDSDHKPKQAYRTYWGEDVNYDRDVTAGELGNTQVTSYPNNLSTTATPVYVYTYENTFDEDHQTFMNTTYVGVKVKLNGGTAFWTVSSDANTKLASDAVAANKIQQDIDIAINGSVIAGWRTDIASAISTQLSTATSNLRTTCGCDATDKIEFTLKHNVNIESTRGTDGSHAWTDKLSVSEVKVNGTAYTSGNVFDEVASIAATATATTTELSTLTDVVALKLKVYSYTGGYAYYTMRISHFGDTETPWNADPTDANQYDKIYPSNGTNPLLGSSGTNFGSTRAAAWLGRWGIVRNNWYQLIIDEITGIGSAEPVDYSDPAIGDTPDDNPEPKYFIAAHIHILPWVLRTQSVKF
ncbi:MAG: Mfa1 fimbrilin C-terminal domain-containing protein [Prevotella sp.]|nr:Mfa1 fimbrilin C-terminal domain-containing protein [Prevotella sp.]